MTATTALVIVIVLLLLALTAALLLADRVARKKRRDLHNWSPFGSDGKLRDDLFTPVSEGGQGFHQVGYLSGDDAPIYIREADK